MNVLVAPVSTVDRVLMESTVIYVTVLGDSLENAAGLVSDVI